MMAVAAAGRLRPAARERDDDTARVSIGEGRRARRDGRYF